MDKIRTIILLQGKQKRCGETLREDLNSLEAVRCASGFLAHHDEAQSVVQDTHFEHPAAN